MSTNKTDHLSGEDIDVIREDLLDGVPSILIAGDYNIPEGILLRAARGELDYDHDAEHPPLEYDPETAEWSIPEEYQQDPDPEPYTIENGRLYLPTHQVVPWDRDEDDSSESSDEQSTDDSSDNADAATQTTMTNMTTTHADADGGNEQTHQTTVGNGNGETVAGTSPDDFGKIRTECWPSHIDIKDVGSELRQRIIQAAAMHREWSQTEIAQYVGCSSGTVSETLKDHWPEHPSRGPPEENILNTPALTDGEVDEIRKKLLSGATTAQLCEEYDISQPTLSKAARGTSGYADGPTFPPVGFDQSAKEWTLLNDSDTIPDHEQVSDPEPEPEPTSEEEEKWTNEQALAPDEVDEVRERLLAGETTAPTLADEFDTTHPTVLKAAKGAKSYDGVGSHPPVAYDHSEREWIIVGEPDPEPEPDHTDEEDITVLAYGEDIFHHRDESGLAACGIWSADDNPSAPLVSLEREEAEKVADECPRCRIASRTTDELLDDIRAELGHSLKEAGTPLTQEELVDVLSRLRDQKRDQEGGV